jgi:signal transduction histidine kinase
MSQKEQMFANISHAFKTPLTLILSPLTALVANPTKDQSSKISMMTRNGQRLLRMIDQLLALVKELVTSHAGTITVHNEENLLSIRSLLRQRYQREFSQCFKAQYNCSPSEFGGVSFIYVVKKQSYFHCEPDDRLPPQPMLTLWIQKAHHRPKSNGWTSNHRFFASLQPQHNPVQ